MPEVNHINCIDTVWREARVPLEVVKVLKVFGSPKGADMESTYLTTLSMLD